MLGRSDVRTLGRPDARTPGRPGVRTPGRSDACPPLFSIFAFVAARARAGPRGRAGRAAPPWRRPSPRRTQKLRKTNEKQKIEMYLNKNVLQIARSFDYSLTLIKGSPPLMMGSPPYGVSSVASSGGSKLWSCCFCCCFCFIYFTMYLYGGAKRPPITT